MKKFFVRKNGGIACLDFSNWEMLEELASYVARTAHVDAKPRIIAEYFLQMRGRLLHLWPTFEEQKTAINAAYREGCREMDYVKLHNGEIATGLSLQKGHIFVSLKKGGELPPAALTISDCSAVLTGLRRRQVSLAEKALAEKANAEKANDED